MTKLFIITLSLLGILTIKEEVTMDAFILLGLAVSKIFIETL